MLAVFERPEESKALYFHLNNAIHLASPPCSSTYKIAGIYAIYKNDVCYYVGQSTNLPSRLATHLTGKYSVVDRVELHFIGDETYKNFYTQPKHIQKMILENNESWLISELKPIENLIVKDIKIPSNKLCDHFQDIEGSEDDDVHSDLNIHIDDHSVTVSGDMFTGIACVSAAVTKEYNDEMQYIRESMEGC